jgi:hypothetical protein
LHIVRAGTGACPYGILPDALGRIFQRFKSFCTFHKYLGYITTRGTIPKFPISNFNVDLDRYLICFHNGIVNSKKEAKMEIKTRFFQKPNGDFFLFGPRGTGKSTWLRQRLKNPVFIDLLEPEDYRLYSARPERLIEVVEAQKSGTTIVVDEIQKVPQLLDVVHLLMERHAGWRFVLTGSSARKLKRAGVDLLAGRAVMKTMHPFMGAELGEAFSLGEALTTGMIPLVVDATDPTETLKAYVSLYLKEEVQMEGLVRNIGAFGRFLPFSGIHQFFPRGGLEFLGCGQRLPGKTQDRGGLCLCHRRSVAGIPYPCIFKTCKKAPFISSQVLLL